jgi:hypothetical protein
MNETQQVVDLDIHLSQSDICQMLEYSDVGLTDHVTPDQMNTLLLEAMSVVRGRGVYAVHEITQLAPDELRLDTGPSICGPLQKFFLPAQKVIVFVATVGDRLEKLTLEYLGDGWPQAGFAMNAISSAAADAAVEAMIDHFQWNELTPNEGLTPPACPGHCGVPLEEQKKLFSLVHTRPIGVRLLSGLVMAPKISISGMVGVGDQQEIVNKGLPCQYCNMPTCRLGRNNRRLN